MGMFMWYRDMTKLSLIHICIGCIIIADCDHGVQIGVYRIPAVLSGYLIIILVDSSHDIEDVYKRQTYQ